MIRHTDEVNPLRGGVACGSDSGCVVGWLVLFQPSAQLKPHDTGAPCQGRYAGSPVTVGHELLT